MAVQPISITRTTHPEVYAIAWTGLAKGDTGAPLEVGQVPAAGGADRSVQIVGTFDSATIAIKGSNDGVTYTTLSDPQGNALTFTATALEAISEYTIYIRPEVAGSGGSTDLDVYMAVKGAH